jgi:hypothetical protein
VITAPRDSRDHDDDDEEPERAEDRGQDRVAARPRLPLAVPRWRVSGRVLRLRRVSGRRVLLLRRVGLALLRPGLAAGGWS